MPISISISQSENNGKHEMTVKVYNEGGGTDPRANLVVTYDDGSLEYESGSANPPAETPITDGVLTWADYAATVDGTPFHFTLACKDVAETKVRATAIEIGTNSIVTDAVKVECVAKAKPGS